MNLAQGGEHLFKIFVHLSPYLEPLRDQGNFQFLISLGSVVLKRSFNNTRWTLAMIPLVIDDLSQDE